MAMSPNLRTFRLRGCPATADGPAIQVALSSAFGDIAADDIRIWSLASTVDPWEATPTKTATLTFDALPSAIEASLPKGEWPIVDRDTGHNFILDTHFLGLTPLNDLKPEDHMFDCIALPGLASHPFGSWQAKGEANKTWMWIRDALPKTIPGVRAIIFGYETNLVNSNSFQSLEDLGSHVVELLKLCLSQEGLMRPVIFIAHSLGGILFKEAVVALAHGEGPETHILSRVIGGVLFGVPSHGMETQALMTMVNGQPNENLVQDLDRDSPHLRSLDDKFSGIASLQKMTLFWAYETRTTATVAKQENGSFARTGPQRILVSQPSATRRLYDTHSAAIFPINENHSDLVKFRQGDSNCAVVFNKLRDICNAHSGAAEETRRKSNTRLQRDFSTQRDSGPADSEAATWTVEEVRSSLHVSTLDLRLETISPNYRHTFEWAFDEEACPLVQWLSGDDTLFWIHGFPGSGKSTLMKYIFRSQGHSSLREYVHNPSTGSTFIQASFFFHDRGTLLQKSLEGLLRSILSQVLAQQEDLAILLKPVLDDRAAANRNRIQNSWTINELEKCFHILMCQTMMDIQLFLLLDALDEYNGRPDYISKFLQSLVVRSTGSRTSLKIVFSSRPWDVFRTNFHGKPSLQLQDYTKDDISTYCYGYIAESGPRVKAMVKPLLRRVVSRAKGVFLWVRLVLEELASSALGGSSGDQLKVLLEGIPPSLEEYYGRIVQLLPDKERWSAYVVFEIVSATDYVQDSGLEVAEMASILACSESKTYDEARKAVEGAESELFPRTVKNIARRVEFTALKTVRAAQSRHMSVQDRLLIDPEASDACEKRIIAATGGLVQVEHRARKAVIRFLHQTVKDFVNKPSFKRMILGRRARETNDNRHGFFAKYLLTRHDKLSALACRRFENTSGRAQFEFINSVPNSAFRAIDFGKTKTSSHLARDITDPSYQGYQWCHLSMATPILDVIRTPLQFATLARLQLHLEECLRRNPQVFKETSEDLISFWWMLGDNLPDITNGQRMIREEDVANITAFLLQNGYDRFKKDSSFAKALEFPMNRGSNFMSGQRLASLFVEYGQDTHDLRTAISPTIRGIGLRGRPIPLLLMANHRLAKALLTRGDVDPNVPDVHGDTPLDLFLWDILSTSKGSPGFVTHRSSGLPIHIDIGDDYAGMLETIQMLVKAGGRTNVTTEEDFEEFMRVLEEEGLDPIPLRASFREPKPRKFK